MSIIGLCFIVELFIVKPVWSQVAYGFLPFSSAQLMFDQHALFSALGIIGATVMPHNLYLHSAIVQHRLPKEDLEESQLDEDSPSTLATIIKYTTADSTIALFLAMFINAAILIVGAAAFHARGKTDVQHIEDASALMREWLGPMSAALFGCALLAAGQSSTVTGTMAGQIVFEGHLQMQMKPWLRRLVTRAVAIVPAVLIILIAGADSVNTLLIYSQVILSFQLPFAIIPLTIIAFTPLPTTDPALHEYWNSRKTSCWESLLKLAACLIAALLVMLNVLYLITTAREWLFGV
jgi:manganese transport protein